MKYTNNTIADKSFDFSVRIVKLYQYLCSEKKEFVLSKQILRSVTSVGANIKEAIGGDTKKDFRHNFSISYKEIRETKYGLRILYKTEYIPKELFESLFAETEELAKMLYTIIKNSRQ